MNKQNAQPGKTKFASRLLTWLKRGLLGLLIFIIALSVVGAVYQTVATQMDKRNYSAPGQLVDVGGYNLNIYCVGENTDGNPTVILESGLGATTSVWAWIQPEVAKTTRVCSYDRAGMGSSDPSPMPRDAQHIATELHTLLVNAKIAGPYVLVGWSYGGLYARVYANQYREEVAGLILIDSSSPEQCTSTPEGQAQCASNAKIYSIAPVLARLSVMRVMSLFQPASGLPSPQAGALQTSFSAAKDWDAQSAEFLASPETNAQVLATDSLGDIPLFIVTATDHRTPPALEQLWQDWQKGFTALSTNSVQRVVNGATHVSLIFDETDSKTSIDAILQVVEAIRTDQPLGSK